MKFPVFSQLAGNSGSRDEFARDCPLQRRVSNELFRGWASNRDRPNPLRVVFVLASVCRVRRLHCFIDRERFLALARRLGKGDYARYLERLPGYE